MFHLIHVYRILFPLLAILLSTSTTAQSPKARPEIWTGYLVDIVCAQERAQTEKDFGAKHTKKCLQMPSCDSGGFGLLTDENEVLRFDDEGNRKARALIMKTNRQANLRALVHGVRSNHALSITKIEMVTLGHNHI